MATEQGVAEVLTYLAIQRAGGIVTTFDSAHPDLYYEPDLLAEIDGLPVLFLVNGSDSFFASQKKVWRNVEEPFQAKCKGVSEKILSISFISDSAKNDLFYVCSKFFDSQYILCDERDDWLNIIKSIIEFAELHPRIPKRDLISDILSGQVSLPRLLDETVDSISNFIISNINKSSPEVAAFKVDTKRYRSLQPFNEVVLQSGSSSDRTSFVTLSLLSMVRGLTLSPAEIIDRVIEGNRFEAREILSLPDLESSARGIGASVRLSYRPVPGGFSIGPVATNTRSYARVMSSAAIIDIRNRMFSCT